MLPCMLRRAHHRHGWIRSVPASMRDGTDRILSMHRISSIWCTHKLWLCRLRILRLRGCILRWNCRVLLTGSWGRGILFIFSHRYGRACMYVGSPGSALIVPSYQEEDAGEGPGYAGRSVSKRDAAKDVGLTVVSRQRLRLQPKRHSRCQRLYPSSGAHAS